MFFYRNYVRKNRFFDILDRKQKLQDEEIHVLRRAKNGHFLKGLVHGLCPKIELFHSGVFHRNHIRKDRFLYCGKNRMILSRKNWSFKKGSKNGHFLKGLLHGVLSKNRTFSYRRFSQKFFQKTYWYCRKKRMILSGKNWSFKKGQKIDIFHGFCPKVKFLVWVFFTVIMSEKIVF